VNRQKEEKQGFRLKGFRGEEQGIRLKGFRGLGTTFSLQPKHLISCLCLLVIALSLFACSRTDQTPAGPPEKITIAFATLPETVLAQVAQAKGFFLGEGLEVTASLYPFGKLALGEVLDGRADFATVAETPVMFAILDGKEVSIVATIQSSNTNHAIVARKDKGIATSQDLRGRRIGTTLGITADFFLDAFLNSNGITRREVTVVNVKPDDHVDAIVKGRVDALSTFYPYLRRAQSKLANSGVTFYEKDIYTETFHIITTQEFVSRNPEKVKRVIRGLVKAEEFTRNNPAEAQRIVADFIKVDQATISDVWADNNFDVCLDQSLVLALEDESRWAIKNKLTGVTTIPNYLNYIYFDGLKEVKPGAVRIIR
jgi:NitT/TauT family transport system substrate-binding protein